MWSLLLPTVIFCTTVVLYESAQLKTFCYINETFACHNFTLSCQNQQVIQVHDVRYKAKMKCDKYNCCCNHHIESNNFSSASYHSDINVLCDGSQWCDIAAYLSNMTGKITVNFTCEDESSENVRPNSTAPTLTNTTITDIQSLTNSTEITSEPDSLTTARLPLTAMTTTSNKSTNPSTGKLTKEASIVQQYTGNTASTFTTTFDEPTTASRNDEQDSDGDPTVYIIVVVALVAVYAAVVTFIIYYRRKRLPSFIPRLVSKLKSPRDSQRLSDQEHDTIKRHMSMSDFGHAVTNMTYDDDDTYNIVTYIDDEVQRDTAHMAEANTANATNSMTTLEVNKPPGENYDIVVRFHKETIPNDNSYDHIDHSSKVSVEYSTVIRRTTDAEVIQNDGSFHSVSVVSPAPDDGDYVSLNPGSTVNEDNCDDAGDAAGASFTVGADEYEDMEIKSETVGEVAVRRRLSLDSSKAGCEEPEYSLPAVRMSS